VLCPACAVPWSTSSVPKGRDEDTNCSDGFDRKARRTDSATTGGCWRQPAARGARSKPGAAAADTEIATASFADGAAIRSALDGTSTVLMVSAEETPDRVDQHRNFIDAAVAAGIAHLVYISFYGAAKDAAFTLARDHWATEEYLTASGLQWTCLRDNLYLDFLPKLAGPDGVIRGPAGDGRVAAVAQDDIADVASVVLGNPSAHSGRRYQLTGPEALTLDEVAAALSGVAGRPIRYERETTDQAYLSRAHYGAPPFQVDAWVSTYTAIAVGELAGVTNDVQAIAGHPPMSLAELLATNPDSYAHLILS
jgi:NAD(P)H dehydrogenase (quinone)